MCSDKYYIEKMHTYNIIRCSLPLEIELARITHLSSHFRHHLHSPHNIMDDGPQNIHYAISIQFLESSSIETQGKFDQN